MAKLRVKVTENVGEELWYSGMVGEVFDVDEVRTSTYMVTYRAWSGFTYGIDKKHCEIVDEPTAETPADNVPQEQDFVNSPSHYGQSAKFETIEMIEEITKGYDDGFVGMCVGNALKYLARAPYKHGEPTEDLRKAARYLAFATEYMEREARKEDAE